MTSYDIIVRLGDGTEQIVASDSVLEGETDEYNVTVGNPTVEATASKLSGN